MVEAIPYKINVVLTDNGIQFADLPKNRKGPTAMLRGHVRILADLLRSGHRTYVHCTAGMGRSPLIVMAYLVAVEGWVPDDAMEMLRRQRSCIAPDWDSYFACRREILCENGSRRKVFRDYSLWP